MVYLVIHGFTDNPDNVPGAYKNFKAASIKGELNHTVSALDADTCPKFNNAIRLVKFEDGSENRPPRGVPRGRFGKTLNRPIFDVRNGSRNGICDESERIW